jgi:hypothetical protein
MTLCPCRLPLPWGERESSWWRPLWGGGGLTAADAAVGTAFFEVQAVSSVLCRFRLRTSWKQSSWAGGGSADFGAVFCPAVLLALSMAFKSPNVTVYVRLRALKKSSRSEPCRSWLCFFGGVDYSRPFLTLLDCSGCVACHVFNGA